jgi:hypothetical protein
MTMRNIIGQGAPSGQGPSHPVTPTSLPPDNRGAPPMGIPGTGWKDAPPPRRDTRRSRSQGGNLVVLGQSSIVNGRQSTPGATVVPLCAYDTGGDDQQNADRAESNSLVAFLKAYDFAENAVMGLTDEATDPFAAPNANAEIPDGLKQSIVVIAEIQWGHDGVNQKVLCNLQPGQVVKAGLFGTYVKTYSKLSAKYFTRFQGPDIGAQSMFFYLSQDPNEANNIFSNLGAPALQAQLYYDRDTSPTTPVHVDGIVALGDATVGIGANADRASRPTRRFYGSMPANSGYPAGPGALVFCPLQFGASSVLLQCNPTGFTNFAGNALAPLLMMMIDHAGNVMGQFPPNQFFSLPDGCQQIIVYNAVANGGENPFTLIYDLGL